MEARLASSTLITDKNLEAFAAAVQRNGWRFSDFELEEDAFDQRKAGVEARMGELAVKCLTTQVVILYAIGDGSDWVADFAADLEQQEIWEVVAR